MLENHLCALLPCLLSCILYNLLIRPHRLLINLLRVHRILAIGEIGGIARLCLVALCDPAGEAAVEDGNFVMAQCC